MNLLYPDLSDPPKHWTGGRVGSAIRLVPPGAYLDRARAGIVISPLVPRSRQLPAPEVLVQQALTAELARTQSELLSLGEPVLARAGALTGVRVDASLRRGGDGKLERRAYVMYLDESWLYGVSYVADEETWPVFLETFERVAASVQPYPAA